MQQAMNYKRGTIEHDKLGLRLSLWQLGIAICFNLWMATATAATKGSHSNDVDTSSVHVNSGGESIDHITEHRLQNGLRVVLAPDDKAQKIAYNLVYLTGALADREGESGTAHMLEHLLLKGTPDLPHGKLISEMTRRGIQFNATTAHDRTRYQAVLPDATQLDWMLSMEAERMVHAQFDQHDLDQEILVVLREMEIAQSNPTSILSQALFALDDPAGYGQYAIGTRSTEEALTLQTVRNFYQAYYRPDNAILVLSGKFDPLQALAKVQQRFGVIQVTAPTAATPIVAMPRKVAAVTVNSARQLTIKRGNSHLLVLAYPTPAAADPLQAEFGVLANVIAANPHGRLYQALVNQNKAVAVFANPQAYREMGMLMFAAVIGEHQSAIDLPQRMSDILEQLDKQPITEQELQRAQHTIRNARTLIIADPIQLGNVIAENAGVGDWRLFFQLTDRVARLSLSDVQQTGMHYLKSTARIRAELMAEAATPTASNAAAPDATVKPATSAAQDHPTVAASSSLPNTQSLPVVKPLNTSKPLPPVEQTEFDKLEANIQRYQLDNGLQLALLPRPSSGNRVRGRLNLRFGDEQNLFDKHHVAALTATMLTYGTRTLSRQQLVDRLTELNASIVVLPEDDHVSVNFESSRSALPATLELLTQLLREPAFPQQELETIRQLMQTSLKQNHNTPEILASEELVRRSNPYAQGDIRRPLTSEQALAKLATTTREDLIRFTPIFTAPIQASWPWWAISMPSRYARHCKV